MDRAKAKLSSTKDVSPSRNVVVVLSGGLDSAVLAYKLKQDGRSVRCVYLDYGKPASIQEKASAKYVALRLNLPLEIVNVHGLAEMQNGYVPAIIGSGDELDVK